MNGKQSTYPVPLSTTVSLALQNESSIRYLEGSSDLVRPESDGPPISRTDLVSALFEGLAGAGPDIDHLFEIEDELNRESYILHGDELVNPQNLNDKRPESTSVPPNYNLNRSSSSATRAHGFSDGFASATTAITSPTTHKSHHVPHPVSTLPRALYETDEIHTLGCLPTDWDASRTQ
jgi:hypothetical protein